MTKRFLGVLLIICLAGAFAFADNDVADSKTDVATARLFQEDQDNYLDVIDYKDITKTMLFLSMGSPTETSGDFQFGFAKRFGGIFVGSRVQLNQIGKTGSNSISETSSITLNTNQTGILGRTVTESRSVNYSDSYDNGADVLIGIGNMGILVGVNHDSYTNTGTYAVNVPTFPTDADTWYGMGGVVGTVSTSSVQTVEDIDGTVTFEDTTEYAEGNKNDNHIGVDLAFGMEMPLGGMDAAFVARVDLDIYSDSDNAEETDYVRNPLTALYATYGGVANAVSYRNETSEYIYDRMIISPLLGFEVEMPVPLIAGSTLSTGLLYDLYLPIYTGDGGTSYSYDFEEYTTSFNGQNLETYVTQIDGEETTEISSMTHTITPYAEIEKEFSERLKLAIGYYPTVEMYSYSSTYTGSTTRTQIDDNIGTDTDSVVVTTVTRSTDTNETNRIRFGNTIAVGTQFMLTEKLRVNAGASASGGWMTSTITKGTVDGVTEYHQYTYEEVTAVADATADPVLTSYDIDETSTTPDQTLYEDDLDMSTSYTAGLTYFYDENLKIDMLASLGGSSNIFDFATWTIEFTYSY